MFSRADSRIPCWPSSRKAAATSPTATLRGPLTEVLRTFLHPVVLDDLLFMVTDKGGIARCLDATTGHEIWKKRLSGDHWASPLYADGKLYFSSKQGEVTVVEASRDEPEILAQNRLDARFIASPAVAGLNLILRSTTHLYCIANGYERSKQEVAREKKLSSMTVATARQKGGKSQKAVNWDAVYERVLASNPEIRKKVENGEATKQEVIAFLKQKAGAEGDKGKPTVPVASTQDKGGKARKPVDWDAAYEKLLASNPDIRKKVEDGGATKEEVIAFLKQKFGGTNGKGRRNKGRVKPGARKGSRKFYAIVIGRLRSKDIELGELEMDVDYALSNVASVKKEVVGERVRLVGVAGAFLDNLLQIKRGETIKVRTGDYNPETKVLGFGYKFQVLERTAPFSPEDFGVPPQEFRGFRGELVGKVVEALGYEVLLQVRETKPAEGSKAHNAQSVHGKRVRVGGFFDKHADAFAEIHEGDIVRVGVTHRNPDGDALTVTDVLERIEK